MEASLDFVRHTIIHSKPVDYTTVSHNVEIIIVASVE